MSGDAPDSGPRNDAPIGPFDGFDVVAFHGPEVEVLLNLVGVGETDDLSIAWNPVDALAIGEALVEVSRQAIEDHL